MFNKKRESLIILGLVFVISCTNNIAERSQIQNETKIPAKIYPYDTILKNGYHLNYGIEILNNDTLQYLRLYHGKDAIHQISAVSHNLKCKNLGFIDGDFNDYFIFKSSYGLGNPAPFSLIKKKNGKEMIRGFLVDCSSEAEIFIYKDFDTDSNEGEFFIYDVITLLKNKIILPENIDIECLENYVCLEIINESEGKVEVEFTNSDFETEKIFFNYK